MRATLQRIIQEANSAPNLLSGLNSVVRQIKEILKVDSCSIFLCDDIHGEYVLLATTAGVNENQIGKTRLRFGEGLIGLVGEREEPINLDNAQLHPKFFRHPKFEEEKFKGFLGVPIVEQGEVLGILMLQQLESRFFSEDEEAFCVTLAVHLTDEIIRARAQGNLDLFFKKGKHPRKKASLLEGLPGAPGIAIGEAIVLYSPADLNAIPERVITDIEAEIIAFENALAAARDAMHEIQLRAKNVMSAAENVIFDAYLRILDSRSLINEVINEIRQGQWAQGALKKVMKKHIAHFESLDDPYLKERAGDFRDLGCRILSYLQSNSQAQQTFPKKTILVSEEVTATILMEIPEGHLVGIISGTGSGNSHVAILARALGLPTVMGVTGVQLSQLSGQECIVDGYNGQIYLSPSPTLKKEFSLLAQEEQQLDAELSILRDEPAITPDQHAISLYVNTGLAVEGGLSLSVGAEGIGLYRTELPFMIRDCFPTEEEQRMMYRQLLNAFAPRPVVMRTLDVGGDKMLPYFRVNEENPFLGWRGIRISLDHPELFLQQVRAMLHASLGLNNLSIMLPMVTSVHEVENSLRLINQAYEELLNEGILIKKPLIGLMIEVPAAVYQTGEFAKRVDFLSVGSNDLIQYLLAVDRNNARVAHLYDALHPAVLRSLQQIVKLGHKAGKPVYICGEMAGDPLAIIVLLGMGFDKLSMNARSLPRAKWLIRNFTLKKAKIIVEEVLKMDDPTEVRLHLEHAVETAGLASLIRAGK